jgi:hypothetical protein
MESVTVVLLQTLSRATSNAQERDHLGPNNWLLEPSILHAVRPNILNHLLLPVIYSLAAMQVCGAEETRCGEIQTQPQSLKNTFAGPVSVPGKR